MRIVQPRCYKPRGPEIKLPKAVLYKKDLTKKRPAQVPPMEAVDKALEANVYAKILASRPKTDTNTRVSMPKSLLKKLGVKGDQFTAISHYEVVKGQRGYIASGVPLAIRHQKSILKKPRYEKIKLASNYQQDVADLAKSDLQRLMQEYEPEGPEILAVNIAAEGVPSIKTNIDISEIITVGKNQSGLRLAAFICCQAASSL